MKVRQHSQAIFINFQNRNSKNAYNYYIRYVNFPPSNGIQLPRFFSIGLSVLNPIFSQIFLCTISTVTSTIIIDGLLIQNFFGTVLMFCKHPVKFLHQECGQLNLFTFLVFHRNFFFPVVPSASRCLFDLDFMYLHNIILKHAISVQPVIPNQIIFLHDLLSHL